MLLLLYLIMRIGINTRFLLSKKMEGFGWYTYETMRYITQNHPEHQFYFFFDRPYDQKFLFSENITPLVIYPPARHPVLQKIWFNIGVTRALKKHKCDLFISPDGYLSLKTKIPQLAVIHDLNFEHNPEDLPKSALNFYKRNFPLFAKKASRICTVSEYSKNDIIKTYGVKPEKIDVTYNGVSPLFSVVSDNEKESWKEKFTKGLPYLVFVGAIHRRKNLQRLLEAFTTLKKEEGIPHHLVIVGEPMWRSQNVRIDKEIESFIHFTGHLSVENLAKVIGSAEVLTFVSYFEGFGIPILEAMKSGTPVLAGNKTALPEVGGDAALYCDPYDVVDIKNQLRKLLFDTDLRKDLIEKGLKRANQFSWEITAKVLWGSMEKILNEMEDQKKTEENL